ncbi:MAG: hypothetical protein DLM73_11285 [Chthoniobacterales bacterium]|nr:MAG: hypothetical protein DLM73_11285 [Chthoniobacterales bacterium]
MITRPCFLYRNPFSPRQVGRWLTALTVGIVAIAPAFSTFAQSPSPAAKATAAATTQPSDAEMMKRMMQFAKPGENHRLLEGLEGSWTFAVKTWMNPADPSAAPVQTAGSAVRNEAMAGRFYVGQFASVMKLAGPDGTMKDMDFRGMSVEGYDNVKKKFVTSWIDNMGSCILNSEGTYDAATKTFTYTGEYEPMPGVKCNFRQLIKIVDNDHHVMDWYEDRGAGEAKTMEISYTRRK